MRPRVMLRSATFFISTALIVADSSGSYDDEAAALVSWLRSQKGFFNSKLEFRRVDPDDSESSLALFTTSDIAKREVLFNVLMDSCIIPSEEATQSGSLDCNAVLNLAKEMRLGSDSKYAPLTDFLLHTQSPNQLPSAWSEAGQSLLLKILGKNDDGKQILPPYDPIGWVTGDWHDDCDGSNDPLEEFAATLVVQHIFDKSIIPIDTSMRHRNGKWLNTESTYNGSAEEGTRGIEIYASRAIKAGEEIYKSENLCEDCGDRKNSYGTPEILRDRGVVEQYPQRWFFVDQNVSFEIDEVYDDDGVATGTYKMKWIGDTPNEDNIELLKQEYDRLVDLSDATYDPEDMIPPTEWTVIKAYYEAMLLAMSAAKSAVEKLDVDNLLKCSKEGTCDVAFDRYEDLNEGPVDLDLEGYQGMSCDMSGWFPWDGVYEELETDKSHYQEINFISDSNTDDTCMDLENTIQICESYRPQYHEMFVHYPARFLDNIKRVLFVGGGDSMLLHETLKYPSLEFVVGLELDQKVVRKCYKYFGTQPHFHNDKVQWWFGDASKSLLMLPKDYFGTFDMILVDLSETVMSFTVTEGLDIMEALTLLLKPGGIFIKNEFYHQKNSEMFRYSAAIHFYDIPITCSQAYSLGSNMVDFINAELKDHNVDNLYLQPLDVNADPLELYHDYSKNTTSAQLCKGGKHDLGLDNDPVEQVRSPGILMIVEAEQCTEELLLSDVLKVECIGALVEEGLSVVSTILSKSDVDKTVMVIILQEGYVVAHTLPEYNYCAFDIHLWSSYEKHEGIRKALLAAVGSGSESSSSFRIIAGGMFGVKTWKDDEKLRGPRFTQECGHQDETLPRNAPVQQSVIDIVLNGLLKIIEDEKMSVAVLCGEGAQVCRTVDALQNNEHVEDVVPLSCPTMEGVNEYAEGAIQQMLSCEQHISNILEGLVLDGKKLSAIIVDQSANLAISQIILRLFSNGRNKRRMLMPNVLVMSANLRNTDNWRRNFVRRFYSDVFVDEPVYNAEVLFNRTDSSLGMDVTCWGDFDFFHKLKSVLHSIETQGGLVSEIQDIAGGRWLEQENFKASQPFSAIDYDQSSPLEQWKSQKPLGYQNIFQLESREALHKTISVPLIRKSLDTALSKVTPSLMTNDEIAKVQEFTATGDGCVLVSLWSGGSVIVMWDGKIHIDINIFMYDESEEKADALIKNFSAEMPSLSTVLHDDHPRGIGRVVNFLKDMKSQPKPRWA